MLTKIKGVQTTQCKTSCNSPQDEFTYEVEHGNCVDSKTAKQSSNWNTITQATTIPSPQEFERLQKYVNSHTKKEALSSKLPKDKKSGYKTKSLELVAAICVDPATCKAISDRLGDNPDAWSLKFDGGSDDQIGIHTTKPDVPPLIVNSREFWGGGVLGPGGYFADTMYKGDQYCNEAQGRDSKNEGGFCYALINTVHLSQPLCKFQTHYNTKNDNTKCKNDADKDVFYNIQIQQSWATADFKTPGKGFPYKELCIRAEHQAANIKIGFVIKYKRNI